MIEYEEIKTALLAQLAERSLSKRKVGGSIPPGGSSFFPYAQINHLLI